MATPSPASTASTFADPVALAAIANSVKDTAAQQAASAVAQQAQPSMLAAPTTPAFVAAPTAVPATPTVTAQSGPAPYQSSTASAASQEIPMSSSVTLGPSGASVSQQGPQQQEPQYFYDPNTHQYYLYDPSTGQYYLVETPNDKTQPSVTYAEDGTPYLVMPGGGNGVGDPTAVGQTEPQVEAQGGGHICYC